LTEVYKPQKIEDLKKLFSKTVAENLEGLVVKDFNGVYAPNMRHWIKIKKVISNFQDSTILL
jgi:ATP-dependent DNA ligase